jgi:hypothetical protein
VDLGDVKQGSTNTVKLTRTQDGVKKEDMKAATPVVKADAGIATVVADFKAGEDTADAKITIKEDAKLGDANVDIGGVVIKFKVIAK